MPSTDARSVEAAALELLGPRDAWYFPGGYRDSLAHCIVDSVYSLRARYSVVTKVRARYDAARVAASGDPSRDGVDELVAAIDKAGGPEKAAVTLFENRNTAPGTRKLKSAAVYEAALNLKAVGVSTTADLRAKGRDKVTVGEVEKAWRRVPGLGRASWTYLLMLAGVDHTKPDIMVRRFVTNAVGSSSLVPVKRAEAAVREAAVLLEVSSAELDHTIWRYQSGRWAGKDINAEPAK